MKTLLTLALVAFASASFADTPAQITADYREKAAIALAKVNATLEAATVPLVAALIKAGDTAGANDLQAQLKAKSVGEPVPKPQSSASALFKSYDAARAKSLEPAQKAAVSRIDAMLASSEGKKLEIVAELGKAREEVAAGKLVTSDAGNTSKNFLKKNNIPKVWGYYISAKYDTRYGTLNLDENGTVDIKAADPVSGTWEPSGVASALTLTIKSEKYPTEKTEMLISGNEATLKRISGMRYLKAD